MPSPYLKFDREGILHWQSPVVSGSVQIDDTGAMDALSQERAIDAAGRGIAQSWQRLGRLERGMSHAMPDDLQPAIDSKAEKNALDGRGMSAVCTLIRRHGSESIQVG
jgi:hypothetical protein